jgi:hypothetical protein
MYDYQKKKKTPQTMEEEQDPHLDRKNSNP